MKERETREPDAQAMGRHSISKSVGAASDRSFDVGVSDIVVCHMRHMAHRTRLHMAHRCFLPHRSLGRLFVIRIMYYQARNERLCIMVGYTNLGWSSPLEGFFRVFKLRVGGTRRSSGTLPSGCVPPGGPVIQPEPRRFSPLPRSISSQMATPSRRLSLTHLEVRLLQNIQVNPHHPRGKRAGPYELEAPHANSSSRRRRNPRRSSTSSPSPFIGSFE